MTPKSARESDKLETASLDLLDHRHFHRQPFTFPLPVLTLLAYPIRSRFPCTGRSPMYLRFLLACSLVRRCSRSPRVHPRPR
jgi:hypothetical protein